MRRFYKLRYIRQYFFVLLSVVSFYYMIKIIALMRTPFRFVFMNNSVGDTHEYIVNTSGCKIPKLDPFHPSIKEFIEHLPDLNCGASKSVPLVYLANNVVRLYSEGNSSQINCTIKPIFRSTDDSNELGEESIVTSNGSVVTSEFSHVECRKIDGDSVVYNEFYPIITHKRNVELRVKKYLQNKTNSGERKFNVLLLGLDSVSKNQFLRHMLKTHSFMKEKLHYIELHGYNKIGPNTYSNIVPMFTGKLASEVPDTSEVPVDLLPLIWKDFMERGYRTQFSEDYPQGSIFNYARKGFNETPVDYYLRPFSLAVEPYVNTWKTGCFNKVTEADVILKWMRDFVDFFPRDPLFAFTFLTRMSHDFLNFLSYHDAPMRNFLKHLHQKGQFNNSFMFFFGDHGFRFGDFRSTYIGRMEGRLPFMSIILPSWFPEKYPQLYTNLKVNEKRLTTPLDIYATLQDLLHFKKEDLGDEGEGRSISLLRYQVPEHRTCQDANINSQWCSCFHREPVPVNNSDVMLCATNIVRKINELTSRDRDLCEEFSLVKVLNASTRVVGMGENSTHDGLTNYLVTLQVTPSNGIFEASIWFDGKSVYTVENTIERVNLYGNQSACVDVNFLKPYCYCKNFVQDKVLKSSEPSHT